MHATTTSKGQATLPKSLRQRPNLAAGDRSEFIIEEGDVVRLVAKRGSVKRLKDMLPAPDRPVTLEEMDDAIAAGARQT